MATPLPIAVLIAAFSGWHCYYPAVCGTIGLLSGGAVAGIAYLIQRDGFYPGDMLKNLYTFFGIGVVVGTPVTALFTWLV